jgi:hypothetical protein
MMLRSFLAVFFVWPALIFSAPTASAATLQAPVYGPPYGLVGYWSFNGPDVTDKVYDRSGQGNNGYFVGGATSSAKIIGRVGQALNFFQTQSYVNAGNASVYEFSTQDFSVAFWEKSSGLVDSSPFINHRAGGPGGGWSIQTNNNYPEFCMDGTCNSVAYPLDDNTWHHVVVVRSGTNANIYVDGVDQGTIVTADSTGPTRQLYFGVNNDLIRYLSESTSVAMDEIRIYNRGLSATEIKALYNAGQVKVSKTPTATRPGMPTGLVGWWTFDGLDVTDKVYDRSGQGNNAYFVGSATSSAKTPGKLGQALKFDGVDDYINLGSSGLQVGSGWTSAGWIKFIGTPSGSDYVMVSARGNTGSGHPGWTVAAASIDNGPIQAYASACDIAVICGQRYTATTLLPNTWYYITGVYNASVQSLDIYVNGILDNGILGGTVPTSQYFESIPALVGARGNYPFQVAGGGFMSGLIDDVRIYNRALSATEVKKLYQDGTVAIGKSQTSLVPSGLVGYWSFNGSDLTDKVYDRSGQGNNGYFIGGATSSAKTIGKVGQAVKFNGSSEYITTSISPGISNGAPWTMSAWVKPGVGDIDGQSHAIMMYNQVGSGNVTPVLFIETNQFLVSTWGGSNDQYGGTPVAGVWSYVTGVFDGTNERLYVNGELVGGPKVVTSNPSSASPPSIGGRSGSFFLNGAVDEVRIYNRALSVAEVKALYNAGK